MQPQVLTSEPVPAKSTGQAFMEHITVCSQDWGLRTRTLIPSEEGFWYARPNGVVQRMSIEDLMDEAFTLAPALREVRAEMVTGF